MSKYTSEAAYVYVIEDESGIIKIGHSINPPRRFNQVQRCCGLCIVRRHISPLCYNHEQIETAMLIEFGDHLKQGEHVSKVSFESVCAALDKQLFQTELLSIPPQSLIPFCFQKHRIRVFVDEKSEVWFCLKDVCEALHIRNPSDVVKRLNPKGLTLIEVCDVDSSDISSEVCDLDSSEVTSEICDRPQSDPTSEGCDRPPGPVTSRARKTQRMTFVNEPNLYRVIFRSDKPTAVVFQDWVFEAVLPSIRQKGYYSLYGKVTPSAQSLVNEVAQSTIEQITAALAPLTQKPVVVVHTHEGKVKRVQVTFTVKLSFEIKEI